MIGQDAVEMRNFLYSLVDWSSVSSVLDLGCGDGYDLYQISKFTPEGAVFVGIDSSNQSLEKANSNSQKTDRFSFHAGDVTSAPLDLPDEHYDVVFSSNLLECVPDKNKLLREIHRILKPGGKILCAHFDWDSQVINGSDKSLVRKIIHSFADWQQPWMKACDGWMGRRLFSTIQNTGLFNGEISSYILSNARYEAPFYGHARIQDFAHLVEVGLIDQSEYERFIGDIETLAARYEYFYSITMFAYLGHKIA